MHDGAVREVAPDWDRSVQHLDVARDGRTLLATANDLGQTPLFSVDVAQRPRDADLGQGLRRRVRAGDGAARWCCGTTSARRPISIYCRAVASDAG